MTEERVPPGQPAGQRPRGRARLAVGWCLVAAGGVLHVVAAAHVAAVDPLDDVVTYAVQHGWVRAAAWAALTGGTCLVAAGWSRRATTPADPDRA